MYICTYNSPKVKNIPSVSNKLAGLDELDTLEVASIQDLPNEVTYAVPGGKTTSEDTDEALLHGYALVDFEKVRS